MWRQNKNKTVQRNELENYARIQSVHVLMFGAQLHANFRISLNWPKNWVNFFLSLRRVQQFDDNRLASNFVLDFGVCNWIAHYIQKSLGDGVLRRELIVVDANFIYRITFIELTATWMHAMEILFRCGRGEKNASDCIDFVMRNYFMIDAMQNGRSISEKRLSCIFPCKWSTKRNLRKVLNATHFNYAQFAVAGRKWRHHRHRHRSYIVARNAYVHRYDSELHRIENNCRYPCILVDWWWWWWLPFASWLVGVERVRRMFSQFQ